MRVLLSIKPEYANKILSGKKKYEYRKVVFTDSSINKILMYATKPVCKIIGEFTIDKVLVDSPENIWLMTCKDSGVSKEFFNKYFLSKDKAYAIKIHSFKRYDNPLSLSDINVNHAPQSFMYIN